MYTLDQLNGDSFIRKFVNKEKIQSKGDSSKKAVRFQHLLLCFHHFLNMFAMS